MRLEYSPSHKAGVVAVVLAAAAELIEAGSTGELVVAAEAVGIVVVACEGQAFADKGTGFEGTGLIEDGVDVVGTETEAAGG